MQKKNGRPAKHRKTARRADRDILCNSQTPRAIRFLIVRGDIVPGGPKPPAPVELSESKRNSCQNWIDAAHLMLVDGYRWDEVAKAMGYHPRVTGDTGHGFPKGTRFITKQGISWMVKCGLDFLLTVEYFKKAVK